MIPSKTKTPLKYTWKQDGKRLDAFVSIGRHSLYAFVKDGKWHFEIFDNGKSVATSRKSGYRRQHTAQRETEIAYGKLVKA